MAGKPKKGIDYAGWSVDIFSNDVKIDRLLDAHGWRGFGVYFYLCQMAFGSEGYFYEWGYDLCATTARKMGGGISSGTVKEAVDYCLQIGLFDKRLFDRWGVLTSRGIQKSFLRVLRSSNRRGTEIYKDIWLLGFEDEVYQALNVVPFNRNKLGENDHSLGENDHSLGENDHSLPPKKSIVQNSTEKKSTVKDSNTPLNPPTGRRETNAEITRRLYRTLMPEYGFSGALLDSIAGWFEYRIERKEYFVSERGMKATLTRLKNLQVQHGDVELIDAIEYSMGNSYKGIFFEKKQSQGGGSSYIDNIKNRVSEVDNW